MNGSGSTHHYVAFKAAAGSLAVGSYTGNGSSQSITGVGFAPVYVIVVPESGQLPLQYTRRHGIAQLQPGLLRVGHPRDRQRRVPRGQRDPGQRERGEVPLDRLGGRLRAR